MSKASLEDLVSIDGVGEVMAHSILSFFANETNRLEIEKLNNIGITTEDQRDSLEQFLAGKTFVLTGSLQKYSRDQASQKIESHGGKVSSSVSKKTSFVVAGPGAGSKKEKAEKLEVEILTEEEFDKLFENSNF